MIRTEMDMNEVKHVSLFANDMSLGCPIYRVKQVNSPVTEEPLN